MTPEARAPHTPRVGLALALLASALATSALGVWQVRRNGEKQAWIAEMRARLAAPAVSVAAALADPNGFAFRRVAADGLLDRPQSIALDHQSRGTHEGVHVLTPLALDGEQKSLLVDRGFVAWQDADEFLAGEAAGTSERVRVEGVLQPLSAEALASGDAPPEGRLVHWNRVHLGALERQLGRPLDPALLIRAPAPSDTAPIGELPEPKSLVDHVQYAITWFAIAGIALAIAAVELLRGRGAQ
ncbi:MAG: SURF1 family protein [Myxococcota bacterium]